MPPVPILRPTDVIKAFEKVDWRIARQKGSHIIMTKKGNVATLSIPNHAHIARGTLRGLITRSGMTVDEFVELL